MGSRKFKISEKCSKLAGFSLIELVIVIAIMAVLIGLVAPAFLKNIDENKKKACRQNREGILAVYQRCVFDSSIKDISLDTASLGKVIPQSIGSTWTTTFTPVQNEVGEYRNCRMKGTNKGNSYTASGNYGVDATTGTAWIKCPDCGDTVSVDMVSWHAHTVTSTDDEIVATPGPTPTPAPSTKYYVTFHENGFGSITFENPQEVYANTTASNPGPLTGVKTRQFACWSLNAGGSPTDSFDFTTPITANTDLYAIWVGVRVGEVWPYSTDSEWWDSKYFTHGGDVVAYDLSGTGNNMYVTLKSPSGIFTSLAGGQFVYVNENNDQKIWYYESMTPEYYSALHPKWLIQLSGNNVVFDITDKKNSDSVVIDNITNGDLVTFIKGDKEYVYVFWHEEESNVNVPISKITAYENHPSNMYRVNPTAP